MENDENQNCEFCQESFGGLNELAKHLVYDHANYSSEDIKPSNKHQNHIKAHKCDGCGIQSFNARALKIHVKNCEKTFSRLHHLKNHIKGIHKNEVKDHIKNVHEKIMKYKCEFDECDKSYTNGVNLTEHVAKFHGKYQEFKCDLCIRSFINSRYLKRHKETIHENPKTKEEENSVHFM